MEDKGVAVSATRLVEVVGDDPAPGSMPWKDINLDNAATTPAAVCVQQAVDDFLKTYGSVHRGSGLKAQISTELYEKTFLAIRRFVGADDDDAVIVTSNTTTAVNRLATCLRLKKDDIVLVSEFEHSSNLLPWRKHATVVCIESTDEGAVSLESLEDCLQRYGQRVRLVAIAGGSNVCGYMPPIRQVARIAHAHGAEVFVDCAQLVTHRPLQIRSGNPEEDLDYVAFSGHKMYAPYGVGVLVGRRWPFEQIPPDLPGGGTVEIITDDDQVWAPFPARAVPGTPNAVGLVAISAAMNMIESIGFDTIKSHDRELVQTALGFLTSIPGITLYGQQMLSQEEDRLPIFIFNMNGFSHGLLAAALGHEYGIAVRHGLICQYGFIQRELGIHSEAQKQLIEDLQRGDRSSLYGIVRVSCGLSTTPEDVGELGEALNALSSRGPSKEYYVDKATGEHWPSNEERPWRSFVPDSLHFLLDA